MFEPRITQPTDLDLIELLATQGMGWRLFNQSGHRPGTRDVPHAWRWRKDRVHIMVYVGGTGEGANVEFNPLDDEACANELAKKFAERGTSLDGWDLSTAEGRRALCEAAAKSIGRPAPEPTEAMIGSPAVLTKSIGEFPPTFLTGGASDGQ